MYDGSQGFLILNRVSNTSTTVVLNLIVCNRIFIVKLGVKLSLFFM